jgi:para-aminobenzoate synthetase
MCAYALVTSSTPTDVLKHFHKVRLDKVVSGLKAGGRELAKHGIDALKLCIQTCLDTQTIFPRRLAEALAKLKVHPLVQDSDIRALYELNLDVHDRWLGDEARNYTPWPRHDELQRPEAEKILHRWSKDAIAAFMKGVKSALQDEKRLNEVASLRQELIETWILSGSRMAGVKSANVLDDLRDTMNEKLESIMRSRTEGLQDVVSELTGQLDTLNPSESSSASSLWDTATRATDLSNGAQAFKTAVLNTHQGRSPAVMAVTSAFDKWMGSVLEIKGIVKSMKEARWDDTFADDVDDDSDDDLGESKQTLLSDDDPRLLEDATQEALNDTFQNLGSTLTKTVETSMDSGDGSVLKAVFILRVVREISDRLPRLRLQDKSSPVATPFTPELLRPLRAVIATHIAQPTVAAYRKSLIASPRASSQSHILWEGNPPLPNQSSPGAFKFLRELQRRMANIGSDLWAPDSVSVLKGRVADEVARILAEHIESIKALPAQDDHKSATPAEADKTDETDEVVDSEEATKATEAVDSTPTAAIDLVALKLKQVYFDALYIQRFTNTHEDGAQAMDNLLKSIDVTGLDDASIKRLRKNATDFAKKTYLLFALLA